MTTQPSKTELVAELLQHLEHELRAAEQTHRETRAGATHEEAKPENDKDTRALEQSYLARGQALRVAELREALLRVRAVELEPRTQAGVGMLVEVRDDEGDRTFLLMPAGGGTRLAGGVLVITPESPWGRALLGAEAGTEREVRIAERLRDFEVVRVS